MINQSCYRRRVVPLVISLVFNVVFIIGLWYIGSVKTMYFKRLGIRIGIREMKAEDRIDYYSVKGWTNTLKKLNCDSDVVFFGNSITAGSSFHEIFPDISICNLGYYGDDLDGMIYRVQQIKAVNPEKVFVMAGINGLTVMSLKTFEGKYLRLVDSINSAVPDAVIYLQSILPVNHEMKKGLPSSGKIFSANQIIESIARHSGCVYVDLFSLYEKNGEMPQELTKDGVHLLPEAYDIWANGIRCYLE